MAATFLRLADVDVDGKRVFVRADLNVPLDGQGAISDDTRIRASVPAIRDALSRGAATMVTSHLGRPSEGRFSAADSLAPIAQRLAELSAAGAVDRQLGRRRRLAPCAQARRAGPPRELPLQRRRKKGRRDAVAQDGSTVRCLRQRRLRDRASRRGDDARHRPVRADSVCRSAAGAEIDALGRARASGAAAGRNRRRLEGVDQADDTEVAGGAGRSSDRRRRHRNTFILAVGGRSASRSRRPIANEAKAILDAFPGKVPIPSTPSSPGVSATAAPALKTSPTSPPTT